VDDEELVDFLADREAAFPGAKSWDLLEAVKGLDSTNVRLFLRRLAGRAGVDTDVVARESDRLMVSRLAMEALRERGDAFAADYFVEEVIRGGPRTHWTARSLSGFPGTAIGHAVRARLGALVDPPSRSRALRLLGAYGIEEDATLLAGDLGHLDSEVASAAREALLSLQDPMRLPEGWPVLPE
jgi:hypothetical protein